jgi:hypothetical protein
VYLPLMMENLGAVSVDAKAGHPNDIGYTVFTQLKLPKSMVIILTSSKSRYHQLLCGGSHALSGKYH